MTTETTLAGRMLVTGAETYLATRPLARPSLPAGELEAKATKAVEFALADPWRRGLADELRHADGPAVAGLLDQAVALLHRDGWVRGSYSSRSGQGRCLMGAVQEARKVLEAPWEVQRGAELALQVTLALRDGHTNLIGWNDHLGRRVGEVLELLAVARAVALRVGGE